jgi:HrpA-like RNA helicase
MPVLDITDLAAALPQYAPLVGLDPGEKTIGVAVSDVTRTVASPLHTIEKTKFTKDAEALFKLMDSRGAVGIVTERHEDAHELAGVDTAVDEEGEASARDVRQCGTDRVALLSPAGRPIAVTADLAGFWRGGWAEVRRELRGRYPKHAWPERPWERAVET